MTVIAALTDGATCWVGGDSAGVTGGSVLIRADPKVFTVCAARPAEQDPVVQYAIGTCGSARMRQLLRYSLKPPRPPDAGDLFGFMCTEFADAVRGCLTEGGWARKDNEQEQGGNFIAAVNGRLFEFYSDYQVAERAGEFTATGSGEAYALGSLHSTLGGFGEPRQRLLMAMRAAAEFSTSVRPPFNVVSVTANVRPAYLHPAGATV